MYGKLFASLFTGSMYGAGPDVFAVWSYVIANTHDSQVELNPRLIAGILGCSPERVQAAIEVLAAPDPNSRSKVEEGRRLIREGEFAYRVPNFAAYRAIKNEEERREYNRVKKREQRERENVKAPVNDSQPPSAQREAVAVSETEPEKEARAHFLNPDHLLGYDHYHKAHHNRTAFTACLTNAAQKFGWPTVSQAVFEMWGADARFSPKVVEAFAAKLVKPTPKISAPPTYDNIPIAPWCPDCTGPEMRPNEKGRLTPHHKDGCPNA